MIVGSLPATSTRQTWIESIELTSADDDSLIDLSTATEVTIELRDPSSKVIVLTLTLSAGDVTFPQTGVISWRAESTLMGGLRPKTYEVGMVIADVTDDIQLIIGYLPVLDGIVM